LITRVKVCYASAQPKKERPRLGPFPSLFLPLRLASLAVWEDSPDFTGWTVLDFKTDREFARSSDRYMAQVGIYSEAIRAATGDLSRGILLVV
jgi:hypothetical protein